MVTIPDVPRAKRSNLAWEMRMRDEFLAKFHQGEPYKTQVRLGEVPGGYYLEKTEYRRMKMLGLWRRYADALVIKTDHVIIYEFALLPDPGDITKLELYEELFKKTFEYEQYKNFPIKLRLISALEDPVVKMLAIRRGIEVILYEPAWLDDYLTTLELRKRRAPAI